MAKPQFEAFEAPPAASTPPERPALREQEVSHDYELESREVPTEHRVGAPSEAPQAFTSIEVKRIDDNIFVGEESGLWHPPDARGVYGGQIVGQALAAALKTVPPGKMVHSVHAYFLMKGDAKHSIIYRVDKLRDGNSFSSRLVTAQQHGSAIFVLMASFQIPHVGRVIEHSVQMPLVPRPEELPTMEQYHMQLLKDPRCPDKWRPFIERRTKGNSPMEMRPAFVSDFFYRFGPPAADRPRFPEISLKPRQAFWMKAVRPLPDDPSMHAAVLAYASDMGLLATAKHNVSSADIAVIASLDHAIWFHAPFKADQWLLYYLESQRATDGRGGAWGLVFTESGVLAATVMQEGVLRLRRERKNAGAASSAQAVDGKKSKL